MSFLNLNSINFDFFFIPYLQELHDSDVNDSFFLPWIFDEKDKLDFKL